MAIRTSRGQPLTHLRIWKFRPPAGREKEFEAAYSGDGRWAELFAKAPAFMGTTLLRPTEAGGWWLTIDRWQSAADFDAFSRAHGAEYLLIDAELDDVAGEEEFVGAFEDAA